MSTEVPKISEMSREDLEDEVRTLRRDVDNLQEWFFSLEDAVTGSFDVGTLETAAENENSIVDRIEALENGDGQARVAGDRDRMLPAHQMFADYLSGAEEKLSKEQRRVALIFGEFVERAVEGEPNRVVSESQMYKITSKRVQQLLESEGELDGVKEDSYPTIASRAMKETSRMTKIASCECDNISECSHADVRVNSGRPITLTAPKSIFHARMGDVYDNVQEDGASDDASNTDVEDSQNSRMKELEEARSVER